MFATPDHRQISRGKWYQRREQIDATQQTPVPARLAGSWHFLRVPTNGHFTIARTKNRNNSHCFLHELYSWESRVSCVCTDIFTLVSVAVAHRGVFAAARLVESVGGGRMDGFA
jgi:hypothetical protein